MSQPDVRWVQRLSNFKAAFGQLQSAFELSRSRPLTELEEQGVIQAFEFTHELAWNTFKDFFTEQGISGLTGSRDVARKAFELGLVDDGELWMTMIVSRNKTSHTYNRQVAADIVSRALGPYRIEFARVIQLFDDKLKRDPI